jgi:hypothetical protein
MLRLYNGRQCTVALLYRYRIGLCQHYAVYHSTDHHKPHIVPGVRATATV